MLVDKKELCKSILGVSIEALKKIESRNKLEERLLDKGYKLNNKEKQGRKVYYNIVNINNNIEVYANTCEYIFGTKMYEEFANYFLIRTNNVNYPIKRETIATKSNVNEKTISKWDSKMIDNDILGKDGYFYIVKEFDDNGNNIIRLTDKYEYNNFLKTSRIAKMKEKINHEYLSGNINKDMYDILSDSVAEARIYMKEKIVYKVNKFYIKENNLLLNQITNLISDIYGYKIENYVIKNIL